jgi:hypothetical protein
MNLPSHKGDVMATEREIFRDSLEPNDADWVAYRQEVLGRGKDCPPLSEVLAFAGGKLTAEKASPIEVHQKGCAYCQRYVTGYLAGRKAKQRQPIVIGPTTDPQTTPQTDTQGMTAAETKGTAPAKAAGQIAPLATGILLELGLNTELSSAFTAFLNARADLQLPMTSVQWVTLLESFVAQIQGKPVSLASMQLSKATLLQMISEEKRAIVREFLQTALKEGKTTAEELDELQMDERFAQSISPETLQGILDRVESVRRWIAEPSGAAQVIAR